MPERIRKKTALKATNLPLYSYLTKAYTRFLLKGTCPDFPFTLQIQTQSYCNGRCVFCPYRTTSRKLPQGTMEWSLFKKIVDELATKPRLPEFLFELHNEPLLDERILDWVGYVKSANEGTKCTIITNGSALDRFTPDAIIQSKLDKLMVSLNTGSKELYEQLNPVLDYDEIVENISRLISIAEIRQMMSVSFVFTELNVHEVREAARYWQNQGIKTRVMGITNRGGSLENYEGIRLKTRYRGGSLSSRTWRALMSRLGSITGCHLPFYQMNILFNGDVIICCHDWNRATVVGNVRDSSLKEIWNSARMKSIRQLILRKRYGQIAACKDCSLVRKN